MLTHCVICFVGIVACVVSAEGSATPASIMQYFKAYDWIQDRDTAAGARSLPLTYRVQATQHSSPVRRADDPLVPSDAVRSAATSPTPGSPARSKSPQPANASDGSGCTCTLDVCAKPCRCLVVNAMCIRRCQGICRHVACFRYCFQGSFSFPLPLLLHGMGCSMLLSGWLTD